MRFSCFLLCFSLSISLFANRIVPLEKPVQPVSQLTDKIEARLPGISVSLAISTWAFGTAHNIIHHKPSDFPLRPWMMAGGGFLSLWNAWRQI